MRPFRFSLRALQLPALLLLSSAANAAQNPQEPQQTIRIQVERVNVGVIVTDARGQFVEGLRREDFHLFDDGTEQPLTDFATIEEPGQVLLLIEAGPAVYLLEGGHLQAALGLLNGLSAGDRVAVVKYAEAPQALLDFTPDKQDAAASFDQLRFNLGYGSLNLSSSVSKVIKWLRQVRGKKTIVLLSTGVDTSSANERAMALQQLKTGDVRLLAVSLAGELQDSPPSNKKKTRAQNPAQPPQQFAQANQLLKQLAEATGGRAYFPVSEKEFSAAYAEIAQLVRHEYSLAFTPPRQDGVVHSIEVRINSPQTSGPNAANMAYRTDYRRAYVAPTPQ
jgi:Ca-activated chloride channel family protein